MISNYNGIFVDDTECYYEDKAENIAKCIDEYVKDRYYRLDNDERNRFDINAASVRFQTQISFKFSYMISKFGIGDFCKYASKNLIVD